MRQITVTFSDEEWSILEGAQENMEKQVIAELDFKAPEYETMLKLSYAGILDVRLIDRDLATDTYYYKLGLTGAGTWIMKQAKSGVPIVQPKPKKTVPLAESPNKSS